MSNKPEMERLYTTSFGQQASVLEVRRLPNRRNGMTIGGYAAVFNALSDPRLGFREVLEPSFFNKSQGDGWPHVRALHEHQAGIVLGTVRAGTLRLKIDGHGLEYEVDLAPSRSDVYESVERGDVYGSSVGMFVREDDWRLEANGLATRHLISGQLDHVSPTATPAYPDATVALRASSIRMDAPYEDVAALAAQGELRSLFTRTDEMVSAPPGVEPATVETRNHEGAQADPALEAARSKHRQRGIDGNRRGRIDLNERLHKSEQVGAALELERLIAANRSKALVSMPEQRALDGRDYYARIRNELGQSGLTA